MAELFNLKSFNMDKNKIIQSRGLDKKGKVQQFIDSECLRLSETKVPKDQSILINSGISNTIIGSGEIKYNTPYARKVYYVPANFQGSPERGNYWFERMKQQYKERILAGAKSLSGAK